MEIVIFLFVYIQNTGFKLTAFPFFVEWKGTVSGVEYISSGKRTHSCPCTSKYVYLNDNNFDKSLIWRNNFQTSEKRTTICSIQIRRKL
jgi:hypothetical protein